MNVVICLYVVYLCTANVFFLLQKLMEDRTCNEYDCFASSLLAHQREFAKTRRTLRSLLRAMATLSTRLRHMRKEKKKEKRED